MAFRHAPSSPEALSGGKSHETATRLTMDDLKRWQLSKDHELLPRTTQFDARPFQPMPIPPDGRLINGLESRLRLVGFSDAVFSI